MNKAKPKNPKPPQKTGEDSPNRKKGEEPPKVQRTLGKQMDLEELIKIIEEEEKQSNL